jgi:hypothetical protein
MIPRRRWFQFSLRGFLVAVTVFAVWLGWHVDAKHRESRAIQAIERIGGGTLDCWTWGHCPKWVRKLIGNDWFRHVHYAQFTDNQLTTFGGTELSWLRDLPLLEEIGFVDVAVADDGIDTLAKLEQLQQILFVADAKTTKYGAAVLKSTFPIVEKRYNARLYKKAGYHSLTRLPPPFE